MAFEQALLEEETSERRPFDPQQDRKTLQLCRQVERALSLALADCGDEAIREASIESVVPMGSASQLLVRVVLPGHAHTNALEATAKLQAHAAKLRFAVAQSICRKRVPALSFFAIAKPEGGDYEQR
jgi:hypothetical protein